GVFLMSLIETDIEAYLHEYESKELLRFVAVGSVDDGKSTLIGRLLHDTGEVFDDQLQAVRQASVKRGHEIDFSLFTDGLAAEREQGITIDVAYRYFSTERRKFIIADTPGHVQYTRNMVTGASTANVALILIDARLGVLQQSRRHAYIADLLGIRHLAVCVNKMDLVGYDQDVYERIRKDFGEFSSQLSIEDITYFPVSALEGDNVVAGSEHMAWYDGPTVLGYLETVPLDTDRNRENFRFPVQVVLRPNLNYRAFAGEVLSGEVRQGDDITVLPSGQTTTVKAIDVYGGELERAGPGQSVALRLADEVDVSRGDMLVKSDDLPRVGRSFDAHLVWMNSRPLDLEKTYLLKHTTQTIRAQIGPISWKRDMDTLDEVEAPTLELNDIGRVTVNGHRALYYDSYRVNRTSGAFVVIDSLTNNTVGAGMIIDDQRHSDIDDALREIRAGYGLVPKTQVSPRERRERLGQRGAVVWIVGLPGSGRWALSFALERRLFDLGRTATVLDPTDEDLESTASSAKACADAGLVTVSAFSSFKRKDRERIRERVGPHRFFEVYVNTSETLCRERRPDANFDGFEAPTQPDVTVSLDQLRFESPLESIVDALAKRHQFDD
ncbi:MAG: sulfate adenylyltransferase subunit CysN, partial [Myxococcota bacterium]